ncbi:aminotransferase class IV [Candidatus Kaiserbacteria bacterium]|nr:aminotransferase class IV [Candidatus Kaiserbacteria bacterium]USN92184.1 MAG: aminotransferase class IV [Candidatus Nomurabacteria bacterium]
MAKPGKYSLWNNDIIETDKATVAITSSAVLYGLSVYSVFFAKYREDGLLGFRVPEHITRIKQSAKIIGLNHTEEFLNKEVFLKNIHKLIEVNKPTSDQFFRLTIHATEILPGVRTTDLELALSVFMYEAKNILPQDKARLKTSLWRRTADTAIPARAKVNGAYVNSALAKQDALDSGVDDCLFLNQNGYVSELSAANIFMVKRGVLVTPDPASDILEGITRRSIIEIAKRNKIKVVERKVALTELYASDEVFACGTSAFVSPITQIDQRTIGTGVAGEMTMFLKEILRNEQKDKNSDWVTIL